MYMLYVNSVVLFVEFSMPSSDNPSEFKNICNLGLTCLLKSHHVGQLHTCSENTDSKQMICKGFEASLTVF